MTPGVRPFIVEYLVFTGSWATPWLAHEVIVNALVTLISPIIYDKSTYFGDILHLICYDVLLLSCLLLVLIHQMYPAQSMLDQNASGTESPDEKYNCIGMAGLRQEKSRP